MAKEAMYTCSLFARRFLFDRVQGPGPRLDARTLFTLLPLQRRNARLPIAGHGHVYHFAAGHRLHPVHHFRLLGVREDGPPLGSARGLLCAPRERGYPCDLRFLLQRRLFPLLARGLVALAALLQRGRDGRHFGNIPVMIPAPLQAGRRLDDDLRLFQARGGRGGTLRVPGRDYYSRLLSRLLTARLTARQCGVGRGARG